MTGFRNARCVTTARIEFRDPEGWGVAQERRFLFVKNRFLLVRDVFTFPAAMAVAAGPVWHAGDLEPAHGSRWWDISYREPMSNAWKVRNPARQALLWFTPRPGHVAEAFLEPSYLPGAECEEKADAIAVSPRCRRGPPYVVTDRWRGEVEEGQSLRFDTLLLPHGPDLAPAELAAGIRVLHRAGEALALEIAVGPEVWTIVDNPAARPIAAEGLETDARVAVHRAAKGRSSYVYVDSATHWVRRGEQRRWPVRSSLEVGAGPGGAGSAGQGFGR